MYNGIEFENYDFEKVDLQEKNWKFARFVLPADIYKDSPYIKEFNSTNLSLTSKVPKVTVRDVLSESGTSTPYTFKDITHFNGFIEYSDILPIKQRNYPFEKCLQDLKNQI